MRTFPSKLFIDRFLLGIHNDAMGNQCLEIREILNMSQRGFAKALGVKQPHISKIENGAKISVALALAIQRLAKKNEINLDLNKFLR